MEDENAHVTFRDVNWIQTFGLDMQNVLDYFSTSQFYDRTCNNEVLKMQTKFNNLEQLNMELSRMVGVEYALAHIQEPILYVIRKQRRLDPSSVIPLESFYIIDGSIFKSPSLYNCLTSRMITCIHHLHQVLSESLERVDFKPDEKYAWKHEMKSQDGGSVEISSADQFQSTIFERFEKLLCDIESKEYPSI